MPDYIPTDPLYGNQWHLALIGRLGFTSGQDFAGLERIWADYTGNGIAVGVWDDGIESDHWDLDGNYDSSMHVSVNGSVNDGQPINSYDGHGTSVAGLIAGENNGVGGVGVAFDASLTAIRIFGGADDINSNWSRYLQTLDSMSDFDVTNHSYGASPGFYNYGDEAKFEAAAEDGRGGLGTINVKSAGNSNIDGNGEGLDASRFTVTVGAVDSGGQVTYYSTYGAHLLVSAPAGSVTTDLQDNGNGYDGLLGGDYTNSFGGTSASSPITAGLVSLILDANPGLGWRDVQNILSYSSVGTGSLYSGSTAYENHSWKWNGADNWNGGGLHYSEDYGYGMINAFNAVRMAEVWSAFNPTAATSSNEQSVSTGTVSANKSIIDLATMSFSFMVSQSIALEHVALTISLTHSYFTDLRMNLISPDGTEMSFYDGSSGDASTSDGNFSYTFGLDGYRGESSYGQWTVEIEDVVNGDHGTLNSVQFTGYGSAMTEDDVYHYTEEVLAAQDAQSGRETLTDADGGVDWIDASAMYRNLVLNLSEGSTSTLAGTAFLTIALGTTIEHAIAGDGDDQITGNDEDNSIYGMRGDDIMDGGDGIDIAVFFGDLADYSITTNDDVTTVSGAHGTDTLTNFEFLKFDDQTIAVEPSGPDITAPQLISSTPSDDAASVDADANLVLNFNETVKAGTGYLTIHNSDGSVWANIDVTDGSQVSITGSSLTINPDTDLSYDSSYYVTIDSGAVLDSSDNAFAGIANSSTLNFSTKTQYNIITGTSGRDRIDGTSDDDLILGEDHNDRLRGNNGDDVLIGGDGKDNLDGGAGNDTASYEGASGDVTVSLAVRGKQETGAAGLDSLVRIENLTGGDGDDELTGNTAANILSGGKGNDILNGGSGNDFLDGGSDTDTAVYSSNVAASTIVYDASSDTFTISGPDGTDTLKDVEFFQFADTTLDAEDLKIVTLSDDNDIHVGSDADDRIDGLAGEDDIDGADGNDAIFGGDDDDKLTGGADDDSLVGGEGTDTAIFSGNRDEYTIGYAGGVYTIDGPDGSDTLEGIELLQFDDVTIEVPSLASISKLQSSAEEGDAGTVSLTFKVTLDKAASGEQSVSYAVLVSGSNAANADDFAGAALPTGTVVFADGETSQIITIEIAGDTEEETDETFSVKISNPTDALIIQTSSASGTIISDDVAPIEVIDPIDALEPIYLTEGRDRYKGSNDDDWIFGLGDKDNLNGGKGNDILNGGSGNDVLNGSTGQDTASYEGASGSVTVTLASTKSQKTGGAGNDRLRNIENLSGSEFADELTGNSESNVLSGEAGDDTLIGGGNSDTFVFKSDGGDDTIGDFSTSQGDIIDISAYGFSSTTDFVDFRFQGGDTIVQLDANSSITISNVNLTIGPDAEDSFLFG